MKILILSSSENGGAGIAAKRLFLGLSKVSDQVTILTKSHLNQKSEYKNAKSFQIKVREFTQRNLTRLQVFLGLYHFGCLDLSLTKTLYDAKVLNEIAKSDLVNIHWVQSGFLSLKGLKRIVMEKPSVLTLHDEWFLLKAGHNSIPRNDFPWIRFIRSISTFLIGRVSLEYKRSILLNSKAIIVPSQWMKSQCLNFGIPSELIHCIPNVPDFGPYSESRDVQNKTSKGESTFTIGFVSHGRLSHKLKNFKELYLACAELRSSGFDIQILVAGARKIPAKTPNWVSFLILNDTEMGNFYNKVDLVVIPSVIENLPQVGIEAQLHGVFVIGKDSGGISETIASEYSGLLYDGGASDLALKIFEVLTKKETNFDNISISAHARNRWDSMTLVQMYLDAFKKVVKNA